MFKIRKGTSEVHKSLALKLKGVFLLHIGVFWSVNCLCLNSRPVFSGQNLKLSNYSDHLHPFKKTHESVTILNRMEFRLRRHESVTILNRMEFRLRRHIISEVFQLSSLRLQFIKKIAGAWFLPPQGVEWWEKSTNGRKENDFLIILIVFFKQQFFEMSTTGQVMKALSLPFNPVSSTSHQFGEKCYSWQWNWQFISNSNNMDPNLAFTTNSVISYYIEG